MVEYTMKKAITLEEIPSAVQLTVPVGPDNDFFTDFSEVRGEFEDTMVYRNLNVNTENFTFNPEANAFGKTLLFLAGMKGSGKTSELKKYTQKLENPDCFFTVTCNVDQDLDTDNLEYMDILILQLENLFTKANEYKIQLNEEVIASMQEWFGETVEEINSTIKEEAGIETGTEGKVGLPAIANIFARLRIGVTGTHQRATKIRNTLKNKFSVFAGQFNTFIEEVDQELRKRNIAQDILFVIDGLEKTASSELRRKIIIDEINRVKQIKAHTIFTLPIELIQFSQLIKMHGGEVVSFPFVKVYDQQGHLIEAAVEKFEEFVYKRVSKDLFDTPETVRKAIKFGGGSPRQVLRLVGSARNYVDVKQQVIDEESMNKAIDKLANQHAQFIRQEGIDKLRELKINNEQGRQTVFDDVMLSLLENLTVMEYNDGTYQRVNPLVEVSLLYQQYVEEYNW